MGYKITFISELLVGLDSFYLFFFSFFSLFSFFFIFPFFLFSVLPFYLFSVLHFVVCRLAFLFFFFFFLLVFLFISLYANYVYLSLARALRTKWASCNVKVYINCIRPSHKSTTRWFIQHTTL